MSSLTTAADKVYFTLATAGHVDHGKTSVLRRLTGIDPDRLKEEKLRQMTTDLGFAHLTLGKGTGEREIIVGFIDVPGHGKFLKNMLAGVGGIHMALLVVAADEGPMPQTISHVKILSLLGVESALVVLTKTDLAAKERQEEVIGMIKDLLALYEIKCLDLVRVSCTQDRGFDLLVKSLSKVLGELAALPMAREKHPGSGPDNRPKEDLPPAYLPIDRVFSKAGYGVVITGTIIKGRLCLGDSVFIEPGGIKARVRGLETFGQAVAQANAGQRLAVNLSLKENKSLARGHTILGAPHPVTTTLIVRFNQVGHGCGTASLQADSNDQPEAAGMQVGEKEHPGALAAPGAGKKMLAAKEMPGNTRSRIDWNSLAGQPIRFYHGTAECTGDLRWIDRVSLDSEEVMVGQLALADATIAEPGDRFVLRFSDESISGGSVLITARPRWLTRPRLVPLLRDLILENFALALSAYLKLSPPKMIKEDILDNLLPGQRRNEIIESALASGIVKRSCGFLLLAESEVEYRNKIVKAVDKASESESLDADKNLSVEKIRTLTMPGIDRHLYQQFVKDLVEEGRLLRDGDKLKPATAKGSAPAFAAKQQEISAKLIELLSQHLCLEIEELAKQLSVDAKTVTAVLGQLSRAGKAQIVNYEYACLTETLNEAHRKLALIWAAKKEISPADFRDEMKTTRKYALAILAYFDDQSVTRRTQNARILLKQPRN